MSELDDDAARVLYANLWEMYDPDQEKIMPGREADAQCEGCGGDGEIHVPNHPSGDGFEACPVCLGSGLHPNAEEIASRQRQLHKAMGDLVASDCELQMYKDNTQNYVMCCECSQLAHPSWCHPAHAHPEALPLCPTCYARIQGGS